jgi:hypothetical protein
MKTLNGLQILDGSRLKLTSRTGYPITVSGEQLGYQHIDTGLLVFTDSGVYFRQGGVDYHLLHENSNISVQFQDEDEKKITEGQIMSAGQFAKKQASPAPFAFIDKTGRLGSENLWEAIFSANIMGWADVDKPDTYSHGLVAAGSAVHNGLFLRKDGQWGQPSIYTGSVSESFLSLNDTPITYTENINKYLRISYAEGGSIVFDAIDTSKVPENENLYYTESRVESKIVEKTSDGSLTELNIGGIIKANEFLADSDRRLKTNIKGLNIDRCLEAVNFLSPKSYRFNDSDKERYGFISQEVKHILPECVNSDGKYESLNYVDMIPILVGAIQSLQNEVKNLKKEYKENANCQ